MKIITSETAKIIANMNFDKFRTGKVMKSIYKTIEKTAKRGSNFCSLYIQKSDVEKVTSILNSLGYRVCISHSVYDATNKKIYIQW